MIPNTPSDEQPREKAIRRGVQELSDSELLTLILGTGQKGRPVDQVAKAIITKHAVQDLRDMHLNELICLHGIGPAKATRIKAAIELGLRSLRSAPTKGRILCSTDAATSLAHLGYHDEEHLMMILLDANNQIIETTTIAKGGWNSASMHPREALSKTLRAKAAAVILAHNHPSGNCTPSDEDISMTRRYKEASELCGITLLDHIIVSEGRHYSMADEGII
ncbi:MAG: DNA repair protein RadC [Nanoarchaeota archaeon]